MPPSKLLYVASMPHSGSTVIGLLLGTHPKMVGLGEFDRSVAELAKSPERTAAHECSCGLKVANCRYWGAVASELAGKGRPNRVERYRSALGVFREVFGEETWPVDSSKNIEALRELHETGEFRLRAIHLLKDVRSLAVSFINNRRRGKGGPGANRLGAIMAIEYFWKWRYRNRKISSYLDATKDLPFLRVPYEKLCLDPNAVMRQLDPLLGFEPAQLSLELADSNSHVFLGNRMRRSADSQRLHYDYSWIYRNDWLLAAVIFPHILRENAELVNPSLRSAPEDEEREEDAEPQRG